MRTPTLLFHALGWPSESQFRWAISNALVVPEQAVIETCLGGSAGTSLTGWLTWLLRLPPEEASLWIYDNDGTVYRIQRELTTDTMDLDQDHLLVRSTPSTEERHVPGIRLECPFSSIEQRECEKNFARVSPERRDDITLSVSDQGVTLSFPQGEFEWSFVRPHDTTVAGSLPPPPHRETGHVRVDTTNEGTGQVRVWVEDAQWVLHEHRLPCPREVDLVCPGPVIEGRTRVTLDRHTASQLITRLETDVWGVVIAQTIQTTCFPSDPRMGEVVDELIARRRDAIWIPPDTFPLLSGFSTRFVPRVGVTHVSDEDAFTREMARSTAQFLPDFFQGKHAVWVPTPSVGASRCGTESWVFIGGPTRPTSGVDVQLAYPEWSLTLTDQPPLTDRFEWIKEARLFYDTATWPHTARALTALNETGLGLQYFLYIDSFVTWDGWLLNPLLWGLTPERDDVAFSDLLRVWSDYLSSLCKVHTVSYGKKAALALSAFPSVFPFNQTNALPEFLRDVVGLPVSEWSRWARATVQELEKETVRLVPLFPPLYALTAFPNAGVRVNTVDELVLVGCVPEGPTRIRDATHLLTLWRQTLQDQPFFRSLLIRSQWDDKAVLAVSSWVQALLDAPLAGSVSRGMASVPGTESAEAWLMRRLLMWNPTEFGRVSLEVDPDLAEQSLSGADVSLAWKGDGFIHLASDPSGPNQLFSLAYPAEGLRFALTTLTWLIALNTARLPLERRIRSLTINGFPIALAPPTLEPERAIQVLRVPESVLATDSWICVARDDGLVTPVGPVTELFKRLDWMGDPFPDWMKERLVARYFVIVRGDGGIVRWTAQDVVTLARALVDALFVALAEEYLALSSDDDRLDTFVPNTRTDLASLLDQIYFRDPPLRVWNREDAFLTNYTSPEGVTLGPLLNLLISRRHDQSAWMDVIGRLPVLWRRLVEKWFASKREAWMPAGDSSSETTSRVPVTRPFVVTFFPVLVNTLTLAVPEDEIQATFRFYETLIDCFWAIGRRLNLSGTDFISRNAPRFLFTNDPNYAGMYSPDANELFISFPREVEIVHPQDLSSKARVVRLLLARDSAIGRKSVQGILAHELAHAWIPREITRVAYHPDVTVDGHARLFFDEASNYMWKKVMLNGLAECVWEQLENYQKKQLHEPMNPA